MLTSAAIVTNTVTILIDEACAGAIAAMLPGAKVITNPVVVFINETSHAASEMLTSAAIVADTIAIFVHKAGTLAHHTHSSAKRCAFRPLSKGNCAYNHHTNHCYHHRYPDNL